MSRNLTIIPTYNEKENILKMIEKLFSLNIKTDILVVDDGSPDGTSNIVRERQQDTPELHLIERSGKLGLGTAYLAGFNFAIENNYDTLVQIDADFSHNPEVLEVFLKEIETNDLVIGSRYINGINVVNWPLRRLMLSYFASKYIQIITRMPINDGTAGFKCWRVNFLKELQLDKVRSNGYSFQVEMHFRAWRKAPDRIKEVPIIFEDRTVGQSKMSNAIVREAIWRVWWLRVLALFGKI
jgi:dolichol-phosphate mannosyltransferase